MSREASVIVVDDDASVVSWLVEALVEEGFDASGETSAKRALEILGTKNFDLVISDVEMPEMRGLELLEAIHRVKPTQMVLLITAFGSIDLAMEAVRAGAVDFLAKPFRIEVLVLAIHRALREKRMRREIVHLRGAISRDEPSNVSARSPTMQSTLDVARRASRSSLPILVTGESGVGKGVLARFVHEVSERRNGKFVQMNCAALPAGIAEAELFGVRRGAFTDAREDRPGLFEQAHGGTLFLDEIGELPMELQPKLLQALESNSVRPLGSTSEVAANPRIVAATNRPLEEALAKRTFRLDLYHRLNVVHIEVPPLRERVEDIEPIVEQVLVNIAKRSGEPTIKVSLEAMRWLKAQRWPGNVRQLSNSLERAVALAVRDVLTPDDFQLAPGQGMESFLDESLAENFSLADLERAYIRKILAKTGGHKAKAAKILGLDRRTLYRKVAEMEGRADSDSDLEIE